MLSQLLANGLISASVYLLVAVGFAVIYRVAGFLHFAHGITFTVGPYLTFLLAVWIGLPLPVSAFMAISLTSLLGVVIEACIYRPLRRKSASSMMLLLASLGVYIVLQNVISMVFGNATQTIRPRHAQAGIAILGARITPIQIGTMCISVALVTVMGLVLKKTRVGRAIRAVANDHELASISGIRSDNMILLCFAMGSALAGTAGILVALDVDMTPTMGMNALMMGLVAVVIGGLGSFPGIALGALLLGMVQHLGVWKIGSQWQQAIAFLILLAFLLLRPEGFLGSKTRKAAI